MNCLFINYYYQIAYNLMTQKIEQQQFIQGELDINSKIMKKSKLQDKSSSMCNFLKKSKMQSQNEQQSKSLLKDLFAEYKQKYERQAIQKRELINKIQNYEAKIKRLIQIKNKKNDFCKKCFFQQRQKQRHQIIQQFYSFSSIVENKLKKISQNSKIYPNSSQNIIHPQLKIIQNFAVFGVNQKHIQSFQYQNQSIHGNVLLSINQPTDIQHQAAKFVFPSGMNIKKVHGNKIIQKVTQVMTKSYSRQNSFILRFQGQQDKFTEVNAQTKQLFEFINPSKRLYCLCIGTYDFTFIQNQENIPSVSTSSIQFTRNSQQSFSDDRLSRSQILGQINVSSKNNKQIAITQRVYCITSYFPFFNFFQDIILSILSIIKVQRLEVYKHRIQQLKLIDSRFQLSRIKQLYFQYIFNFNKSHLCFDSIYQLKLLNQTHTLHTKKQNINFNHIQTWIYQIISLFNVDNFIEVLTLVLLEDRVVFICQNSHILTYTIYLFGSLLCRPFVYTFPSVYIIPNQQFLNAPFPVLYGLLKKRQWVQDNRIQQRFKNSYVYLSAKGVQVVKTQKQKRHKYPQKLRSILSVIFQELEKSKKQTKKQLKYDKQSTQYVYHTSQAQKQSCEKIIQSVKKYLTQQIFQSIPIKQKIMEIKNSIVKQNIPKTKDYHTYMLDIIISAIIQQRKITHKLQYKNTKQITFFQLFMQTQTINVFLSNLTN